MPFDEVLDAVGDDGAREMFVGDVIDASARSNFDPKLIALGWALAKGVLTQDEAVFQQEVNFYGLWPGSKLRIFGCCR